MSKYLPISFFVSIFVLAVASIFLGSSQSYASVYNSVNEPIKLASFYKPLNNLTPTQMAAQMQTIILTRGDESTVQAVKQAGFTNPILQYLRLEAIQGPAYLANNAAGLCNETQRAFTPYRNQVANEAGEFCVLHDNIVRGTAFDHDLNASTPDVVPTENWFLHNTSNQRIGDYSGGGFYYHMNPGNVQYQQYYGARVIRELQGNATHSASGMDGIFLDNLELSWAKKARSLDVAGQPVEYASSSAYVTAVKNQVAVLDQAMGNSYPLWANMIENPRVGSDWNQFAPYLEGGMEESFALDWDGLVRPATDLTKQWEQATWWMSQGKSYLAVTQGTNSQTEARYGLAALLLITDSLHGVYRHADSSYYRDWWSYPEYGLKLGQPVAARELVSGTTDVIWRRQFQCGLVEVNVTKGISVIEQTTCTVTASPSPSPTVSPSPSPSPTVSPSPSPSPTISPSPSPSPSSKPGNGRGKK